MEIETILTFAPYVLMILIGAGGTYYLIFKKKLSQLRKLIVSVDDALYDDAVTEAEFREIFENLKEMAKRG